MARRRSLLRDLTRAADAIGGAARRAARDRERALRRERAAAERQARALERLAKEEEREMALASAAQEHEENEALLAEIRDLLRKAPSRLRTREDHEAGLRRDPFPPPGRLEADRERLEAEVTARVAAARPPRHALLTFLTVAGGLLVLAGLALALAAPWAGLPCLALGLAQAFWAVRAAHGLEKAFVRAEEGRAREEASASIAEDLERDRAAHERREDERIARLRALLEGEARACAEAFQLAADRIDLPLDASAVLAMADPEVAELHVNLHAAEEVPLQRSTLLKSGRITYRNRPKREVGEDDARAIASLCLLHAAAAFDVAPTLDTIVLSAFRSGVDPATGHDADLCHASAIVEREAFGRLKLDRADPIAALRSFDPRFDCSASFLLKTVAPFRLADLEGDRDREGSDRGEEGVDRRGAGAGAGAAKALDLAEHALALAMACARADGGLEPAEAEAVSALLAERFPLSAADSRRLASRRAALAEEAPRIDEPARALKEALAPRDRRLLLERLFAVLAADGAVHEGEAAMLRAMAAALDVSPAVAEDLLRRWAPAAALAPGQPAGRARWLAALDLPGDAVLDRLGVERAARRMEDVYAAEKFALVAPELREMARARLELAREAARALLRDLPEAPPQEAGAKGPGPVRRENPDLDGVFGG